MMMSVVARDRARLDHTTVSPMAETEWSNRRSIVARILWGSEAEFCAECGMELKAGQAYRDSTQVAYCSVEHAALDHD